MRELLQRTQLVPDGDDTLELMQNSVSAATLLETYTHALALDIKDGIYDMDGQVPAFRRKVKRELFALFEIPTFHVRQCTQQHLKS